MEERDLARGKTAAVVKLLSAESQKLAAAEQELRSKRRSMPSNRNSWRSFSEAG
jgi:hypothetical protein